MFKKRAFLVVLLIVFLSGCASAPVKDIKVSTQLSPKTNFMGYKTYSWLASASILNDPRGQWEPTGFDADAEIKYLMDRELRYRGMSESQTNPDLLAVFAAGVDMDALGLKVDKETQTEILSHMPQGGLLLALVDSQTGMIIWMGVATGEVQKDIDEGMVKARLEYAVKQMFKEMPKK